MNVRFGIDIGVASVGWAVVNDEYEVVEACSNIFSSADANQNVERRNFRQMKRLHRRRKTRVSDFEKLWKETGRDIPVTSSPDVLELRVKGIKEKLTEEQIYFVLKNELLHRGISYLDDAIDESNSGKSDYEKGICLNQRELEENTYPCEVQLERMKKYGKYRGNSTVEIDGEKVTLSNVFTTGAYKKEIIAILTKQQNSYAFLTDEFVEEYIKIFSRKREYYVGPGNEKSRTDYGKYTTQIDPETGEYITEENIFEKLIGKCSVYKNLTRAAGATYTAQEFNLLNDLNNIQVNARKLTREEKEMIVAEIKSVNSVNMRKIIKKAIGEDVESITGARLDKNDKEEFHQFKQYNLMRKTFEKNGWDIKQFSREELDDIGEVLTLNTERESILGGFQQKGFSFSEEMLSCLIDLRKNNGTLFSKWQSFSLKIMKELIPDLYEQPKNQMELLTDMGVFKNNRERFIECNHIPEEVILENIYNPVVSRSIRVTIRVINKLIKKYGYPKQIVIEMPRDKNEEEQKKRITDAQKKNQKELDNIIKKISSEYGIKITEKDFRQHKNLVLKLKLWNEQKGVCLYSGKTIDIEKLVYDQSLFEVDHIIPKSISFDDSRTNKVLVYATENQDKGNKTPYLYLSPLSRSWGYEDFLQKVLELNLPRKKVEKLLFTEDITKVDVLKGFVARNINDTRYASRVVLNTLQDYFHSKNANTTVKVVRGSFTNQLRKAIHLEKDRDESYVHHAVDAMLICYSQMGLEAYHKVQGGIIDFETGEILDYKRWEEMDKSYEELMYQEKAMRIRKNIKNADVKYWHKRDTKPNRGLCNQTIRGTRTVDGTIMKVNKINIYTPSGVDTLKKIISKGDEQRFLMYRNDRRTWDDMLTILDEYCDSKNPFADYEKETGDYLRKYSKKRNGTRITNLKYLDGEVGSCIDISHKYGHKKDCKKVILESLKPYRTDVYYHAERQEYYLIGLKYSDLKFKKGKCIIDEEAYKKILINEKLITSSQKRADLEAMGYEFRLSFYKNDIIEYEKGGEYFIERFWSRTKPKDRNYIETKPINASKFAKQNQIGLSKTRSIRKIRLDILGNRHYCTQEKFELEVDYI